MQADGRQYVRHELERRMAKTDMKTGILALTDRLAKQAEERREREKEALRTQS